MVAMVLVFCGEDGYQDKKCEGEYESVYTFSNDTADKLYLLCVCTTTTAAVELLDLLICLWNKGMQ